MFSKTTGFCAISVNVSVVDTHTLWLVNVYRGLLKFLTEMITHK